MSPPRGAGGVPPPALSPYMSELSLDLSVDLDGDHAPGTKKRKGPVPLVPGSEADADTGRDGADRNPPRSAREDNDSPGYLPIHRLPRSAASQLAAQRRALFAKRKNALVALYLDAQNAYDPPAAKAAAAAKKDKDADETPAAPLPTPAASRPTLPDVSSFERLLPALEDMAIWPPDAPGWREGDDAARPVPRRTYERWRTGFARRKRQRTDRVPVARGGWAPEGSFELDLPTDASTRARARARERHALARLAEQLRALVLSANKIPSVPETTSPPPTPTAPDDMPPAQPPPAQLKKTKKKKKKRTTLANEGNPHHVDKYRPSRPVPVSDPYEPWPSHAGMLFPPSMKVLAARPGGTDVRPGEDDYICWSCQYSLFYGPEARRRHAIKQRRAELKRREKLRARAQDVAAGRVRRPSEDDDDDDEYDDDEEDDDDEVARCSCGRALHGGAEKRVEGDKDPPGHACL